MTSQGAVSKIYFLLKAKTSVVGIAVAPFPKSILVKRYHKNYNAKVQAPILSNGQILLSLLAKIWLIIIFRKYGEQNLGVFNGDTICGSSSTFSGDFQ